MLTELNREEIEMVLKKNYLGRIGYTDGLEIYIVPVNYRFENNSIICYSLEGQKVDMMRRHHEVCFQVDEITDTEHWKCVLINGTFEEITDERILSELRPRYHEYRLRKKADLLSSKQGPEQTGEKQKSESPQIFFKINIRQASGRLEEGF